MKLIVAALTPTKLFLKNLLYLQLTAKRKYTHTSLPKPCFLYFWWKKPLLDEMINDVFKGPLSTFSFLMK